MRRITVDERDLRTRARLVVVTIAIAQASCQLESSCASANDDKTMH
jgi:hypothetical protein